MASVTLNTRYRPVRVGFCVRDNDLSAVITAMDWAHVLWGGRFCPIIPCDDLERAMRLAKSFGVDALYPVTKDNVIDAVVDSCKPIAWPFLERNFFVHDGVRQSPQLMSVIHPIRKLRARRDSPTQYPSVISVDWDETDPLAPWFCALIGRYPENEYSEPFRAAFKALGPKHIKLNNDADLPAELMHQIRPNSVTASGLHIGGPRQRAIYVATGDIFYDIVSFWNIRASGEWLAFYDARFHNRLDRLLNRFQSFDSEIRPAEENAPRRIWVRDRSGLSGTPFEDPYSHKVDSILESSTFAMPRFLDKTRSVLGSMEDGEPPSINFALPEKPCFETIEFHREHLVFEVTTFHNALRQTEYLFPPPPIEALNDYYARSLWQLSEGIRAMPRGVAFFVSATDENFHIAGLETYGVIEQILKLADIRVSRSRPGLIAKQLIQQMGGLQGCRVFKIPGVRALIEKYGPTESFVRSEAIQMIRDSDFASHESLFLAKRAHKSLTPEDVFGFLLDKEVFRAGLEFQCPNCQLPFWKHIDDCVTKLGCEYCGKVFNVTPQLRHRGDWRFRRSGLFGANDHQEGSVPVLLTLQQIETNIHEYPLTYSTAVNLEADTIRCESDLLIIHDDFRGNVEIVLSECKTRDEITQSDVDNLFAIAEKLDAVGLKVFLLFSKTAAFTDDEISRFKNIKERAGGGTILMSTRELEPYSMYERATKDFHVETYGGSFDDMVIATRDIYLTPRPRSR